MLASFAHFALRTGQLVSVTDKPWAEFDMALPYGVSGVFYTIHLNQGDRPESFQAHSLTDPTRAGSSERPFHAGPENELPWAHELRRRHMRPGMA